MLDKELDYFLKSEKDLREIAELRYNHYQNKRRKYFEQISKVLGPEKKKKRSPYIALSLGSGAAQFIMKPTFPQISKDPHQFATQQDSSRQTKNQSDLKVPSSIQLEDIKSYSNLSGGAKQVGKAMFFSPQHSTQQHQSNFSIDSKLNSSLMTVHKQLEKEQQRVEKMKKVRQNAIQLAEQEIKKYQVKITRGNLTFQKFEEFKNKKNEEEIQRKANLDSKRERARQIVTSNVQDLESKSLTNYDWRVKEMSEISQQRIENMKKSSQRSYQSIRKKFQEDDMNFKKKLEKKRMEDSETNQYLMRLELKIARGQEKAHQQVRQTISKASRYSEKNHETYRNYQSLVQSSVNSSLERVTKKDSEIGRKLGKKLEFHSKKQHNIRDNMSQRFDRNRNGKFFATQDLENKTKMTLDRHQQKERLREIIIEQQELEYRKRKEVNTLRRLDVEENKVKEREQKENFKSRILNKMQAIEQYHKGIEDQRRKIQRFKRENFVAERGLIEGMKPQEILVKARLNLTLQTTQNTPVRGGFKSSKNSPKLLKALNSARLTNSIGN